MSQIRENLIFSLIGTPFQQPVEKLRWVLRSYHRSKNPELSGLFLEEQYIRQWMQKVIKPTTNCGDIGCHLGSMLNEMVTLAPHGRHFAVEPLPHKAERLRRKYEKSGKANIYQMALAEMPGETDFFFHTQASGLSGLRSIQHDDASVKKITVQCHRLDDIVPADRRLGFLKVDVEGAELLVFRGARSILTQMRPNILFECSLLLMDNFDITPRQIFDFFNTEVCYRIYLVKDCLSGGVSLDYEGFVRAMSPPMQALNFAAIPIPEREIKR